MGVVGRLKPNSEFDLSGMRKASEFIPVPSIQMEGFKFKGAAAANSRKLSDAWMEALHRQSEEVLRMTEREIARSMVESLRGLKAELDTMEWMYRNELF